MGGVPERYQPPETIIINIAKNRNYQISVWIMYRYLASEEKKDVDFIFYGRDMDQSLCARSAHASPHSRGALWLFLIGKKLFFKGKNVTEESGSGLDNGKVLNV